MLACYVIFFLTLCLLIYLNNQSKENFMNNSKIYQDYKSKMRKHHRNINRTFEDHKTEITSRTKRLLRKLQI